MRDLALSARDAACVAALAALMAGQLASCSRVYSEDYLQWDGVPHQGVGVGTLGEGDRFSIRVYQEPDMSADYLVARAGTINFPLIGEVAVRDRSCGDIEREIAERLGSSFLRNPSVSCQVLEINSVTFVVSGEVRSPGVFAYTPNLTVVEAVARAQGVTANAAPDRVIVTRVVEGRTREILIPLGRIMSGQAPNFVLWPNDSVFVPSFRLIP